MPNSPATITVQIQAQLTWLMAKDPESGIFLGICPALNLNALGDTWGELLACANDATATLFLSLFEDGELDRFLRENSWSVVGPAPERGDRVKFEAPFNLEQRSIESIVATA